MNSQSDRNRRQSWQDIRSEFQRRIQLGIWRTGELIPKESDLAVELNCARTTVNRALRDLADAGLLDRKRKAGTRVSEHPVRKATLSIPITRHEVEQIGRQYSHREIQRVFGCPPADIAEQLQTASNDQLMHLQTLHLADKQPFMYEDRWVNTGAVPDIRTADLAQISANEWLVQNTPISTGRISFSADSASAEEAQILGLKKSQPVFIIERLTWLEQEAVTWVRLVYPPGFKIRSTL